jgi:hypothetical protein
MGSQNGPATATTQTTNGKRRNDNNNNKRRVSLVVVSRRVKNYAKSFTPVKKGKKREIDKIKNNKRSMHEVMMWF